MTILTAVQVADYWIGAGGPKSRAVEWVAIAIGESGFNDQVVSPAGAIGVWQIMPFNAGVGGGTVADLYNPAYNAKVAVLMSGGGANCAAWDSCYVNINASGRYTFLGWPEQGSADWFNLVPAQAALLGHGLTGITNPGPPGMPDSLEAAIKAWQDIGDRSIPAVTAQVAATTRAISATYKQGWRP